jgi:hypothetical protein
MNNRNLFLTVLELRSPRSRHQLIWCLVWRASTSVNDTLYLVFTLQEMQLSGASLIRIPVTFMRSLSSRATKEPPVLIWELQMNFTE